MSREVYDKVWIMQNNKPTEMLIFAIIDSMDYWKTGVERHYRLVQDTCGTGWGNNEGIRCDVKDTYETKELLLASL